MYRLIYKSRSIRPIDWELVDSILETSEERNSERGISGVLLATKNQFLQVIEGSFEEVNALFANIVKDSRHQTVQLISFTCTENRLFKLWAMHGVGMFNFNKTLSDELKKIFGERDDDIRLPNEEWEALAMINHIRQVAI